MQLIFWVSEISLKIENISNKNAFFTDIVIDLNFLILTVILFAW